MTGASDRLDIDLDLDLERDLERVRFRLMRGFSVFTNFDIMSTEN